MDIYSDIKLLPLTQPSIRLLELYLKPKQTGPGSFSVHGYLQTYSLENVPSYEALSYAWDFHHVMEPIVLNSFEFPISAGVREALEHLLESNCKERGDAFTRIWIDGICINQSDTTEKSSQVAQMKDVYTRAYRCLVWLGPADQTTSTAFDTLERFAADDGTPDGSQTSTGLQGEQISRREAVRNLLNRPWFQRIWVIQEVVVAENVVVQCGHLKILWETLYIGIRRMTGCGYYPFSSRFTGKITGMGQWRETFLGEHDTTKKNAALEVKFMIMDGSEREATDPRDKLFALRGIASPTIADSMVVDYSLPVEQAYTDFSRRHLNQATDLRLLSLVRQRQRQKSALRLPSWVPDWSVGMDDSGVLQRYYRFEPMRFFKAALDTRPRLKTESRHNAISISGIRIDNIKEIISVHDRLRDPTTSSISMAKSHLMNLASVILPSEDYTLSGEPSWLALFRTITADRSAFSDRINDSYRMTFLNRLSLSKDSTSLADSEEHYARPEFSESIKSIINGKVLFKTDRDFIGLTEQGCVVGDIVCIFLGGPVPFVIRTQPGGTYHLHGEAYVHGVMDGEALQQLARTHETFEDMKIV